MLENIVEYGRIEALLRIKTHSLVIHSAIQLFVNKNEDLPLNFEHDSAGNVVL